MERFPVRQGGKLPKRVRHSQAIELAELYIAKNLPKFVGKLEELAVGVLVVEAGRDGKEHIYRTPPDREALKYLLDRGLGKLPSKIELTGDEGGPVEVAPWAPASETVDFVEGELAKG